MVALQNRRLCIVQTEVCLVLRTFGEMEEMLTQTKNINR